MTLKNISTEKEKNDIKSHIDGEIKIFKECYQKIKDITEKIEDKDKRDKHRMELECFLLHSRNLLDFLLDKKFGKNSDVLISDFIKNEEKREEINKILSDLNLESDIYKRINKQLSHITYSRLDNNRLIGFFDQSKKIYEKIIEALKKCKDEIDLMSDIFK